MKIGFVSLPASGHLNPMTALARKMQARGHEVVFIGYVETEATIRAANLRFVPFCESEYPAGSIEKVFAGIAKLQGFEVVRYTCQQVMPGLLEAALKHLPKKIAETGVELLVVDAIYFYLSLVPMRLGIPYVHIWTAHHLDFSGATPPSLFGWPYETTAEAMDRNLEGLKKTGEILGPLAAIAQPYAEKSGLQIDWNDPTATISKLAAITQSPKEFDFPNPNWPPSFHYAGPFHDDQGRLKAPFPWKKLTGKPLVYASLGTIVNGLEHVYRIILEAMGKFPETQTVLSIGRNIDPDVLGVIPSNVIAVSAAPQIELLKRATLCITHAGLNTTLESLAQGVPMVAIPIGYDQPGVAARIAHHGVGEFVGVGDLTADRLLELVQRVATDPGYRVRARQFRDVIANTRGLDAAAEIIEQSLTATGVSNRPGQSVELLPA
jgi:MGT family glycosyltransferase